MLTKEQRAHDLAVALITKIDISLIDGFPSKSRVFDITKDYENAYKYFLDSFEDF